MLLHPIVSQVKMRTLFCGKLNLTVMFSEYPGICLERQRGREHVYDSARNMRVVLKRSFS